MLQTIFNDVHNHSKILKCKITINFYRNLLAGIAAGLAGTTLGHPLDTIKTRLQTQHIYHGAFHCAREIAKNEGVRSRDSFSKLFSA